MMNDYAQHFIKFAAWATRPLRQKLVQRLRSHFSQPTNEDISSELPAPLQPFAGDEKLKHSLRKHPQIQNDLLTKILDFFQKLLAPLPSLKQEQTLLWKLQNAKAEDVQRLWREEIRPFVAQKYPQHSRLQPELVDALFRDNERVEAHLPIRDYIAEHLAAALDETQTQQQQETARQYLTQLHAQIDQYERLQTCLAPFDGALGRLWDLSRGTLRDTHFNVLLQYSALLEKSKDLHTLAEMLGKWRSAERQYEEETYLDTHRREVRQIVPNRQEEFIGVRESDDLNNLLPTELVYLADSDMESIFFKKFAEKKLYTWEYQARERASIEEERQAKRQRESAEKKGPIIICVDTSGSMHGTPEQVAKLLAFAILRIALADARACYLVSFSTQISCIELTSSKGDSLARLVAFLSLSFHGGTDAQPALEEALRMLQKERYEKADILMISDFIMQSPSADLTQKINQQREPAKTKFHALCIGTSAHGGSVACFDHTWHYDPRDPQALIRQLRKMKFERVS